MRLPYGSKETILLIWVTASAIFMIMFGVANISTDNPRAWQEDGTVYVINDSATNATEIPTDIRDMNANETAISDRSGLVPTLSNNVMATIVNPFLKLYGWVIVKAVNLGEQTRELPTLLLNILALVVPTGPPAYVIWKERRGKE